MPRKPNCVCGHSALAHKVNPWYAQGPDDYADCRECNCKCYTPNTKQTIGDDLPQVLPVVTEPKPPQTFIEFVNEWLDANLAVMAGKKVGRA